MDTTIQDPPPSKPVLWTSYVLSAIPVLILLFSGSLKFVKPEGMQEGMDHLGWRMDQATALGIIEISCTIIYLIPRTAVLGAILIAAYMGGAIATHMRVGDAFVIQIGVGVLAWLGLWLREPRLKALLPLRS